MKLLSRSLRAVTALSCILFFSHVVLAQEQCLIDAYNNTPALHEDVDAEGGSCLPHWVRHGAIPGDDNCLVACGGTDGHPNNTLWIGNCARNVFCRVYCNMQTDCPTELPPYDPVNSGDNCNNTSNPINIATGNKFFHEVDFIDSSASPIRIERFYNSLNSGNRWQFYYQQHLTINPSDITVTRPDGQVIVFAHTGMGYDAPSQRRERLTSNANGFTLQLVNNTVEYYNSSGQLTRIQPLNGDEQFISYAASGSDTLMTITVAGRSMDMVVSADGRVLSASGLGRSIIYTYQAVGADFRLTQATYQNDNNTSRLYHYENTGFPLAVTGITDENGDRISTVSYNSVGQAYRSERGPLNSGIDATLIRFESDGSRIVTNTLNKQTTYRFTDINGEYKVTQVDGHASANCAAANMAYTYDANGFVETVTDWEGNVTFYDHNILGQEISRTEAYNTAEARTITTAWDSQWNLPTSMVYPYREVGLAYYPNGQLERIDTTHITDGTQSTHFVYNSQRLIESIDGSRTGVNDTSTTSYHPGTNNVYRSTNALGHQVEFDNYNDRGQARTFIDANGVVTTIEYHLRGWIERITVADPSGDTTRDSITEYVYDDVGQLIESTSPSGTVLTYEYDDYQRLAFIRNSRNEFIRYTYNNAGNQEAEEIFNHFGSKTFELRHAYDELNRVIQVIEGRGQTSRIEYDSNHNTIGFTNGRNYSTYLDTHDPLNRLRQTIDALGHETGLTYDAHDRLDTVTDDRQNVTDYDYDAFDNVIQVTSPETGMTLYQYDDANNLIQMTDARGVVSTYAYDALNRLTSISDPADPSENVTYSYDGYTMDSANPDVDEAGSYPVGRLTGVDSEYSQIRFYYDHRGNITKQKETILSAYKTKTYLTRYSYRLDNQVETMTYPSGLVVTYGYDDQGRVSRIDTAYHTQSGPQQYQVINEIRYEPFGPVRDIFFGNGLELAKRYYWDDYRMSLSEVWRPSTSDVLVGYDYRYDDNGNITDLEDYAAVAASFDDHHYDYDPIDRLSADTSAALVNHRMWGNIGYEYDSVGNRTRTHLTDYDYQYQHYNLNWQNTYLNNSNQLDYTYLPGSGYGAVTYDDSGNLTYRLRLRSDFNSQDEITENFTYNHAGRLSQMTREQYTEWEESDRTFPLTTLSFGYNAMGQRVHKRMQSAARTSERHNHFIHNLQGQLLYDEYGVTINGVESGIPLLREWIYLHGEPIAQVSQTQQHSPVVGYGDPYITTFYLDHRSAPRMGFDQSGNVVWQAYYSAFAEDVNIYTGSTNVPVVPLRMAGQYADTETGLFYNQQRYYDPGLGRYITSDPLGLLGGLNTYAYVDQNPVNYIDPTGEIAIPLGVRVGAAVGAAVTVAVNAAFNCNYTPMDALQDALVGGLVGGVTGGVGSSAGVGAAVAAATGRVSQLVRSVIQRVANRSAISRGGWRPPRIRGTQRGSLSSNIVSRYKQEMAAGRFNYTNNRIGGYRDARGTYHVGEGHHRIAAAREIYRETGNSQPLRELVRYGRWDSVTRPPIDSRVLPSRSFWGNLRNYFNL